MQAMEISRTALDVEWRRLEIIATNIANANSVRLGQAPLYQAQHLISGPKSDFAARLDEKGPAAPPIESLSGVAVYGIETSKAAPRLVHEPGNPHANAAGFVEYPAIDYAEQMTLMVKTARAYEANIVAMNSARQMYSKALDLGKRS